MVGAVLLHMLIFLFLGCSSGAIAQNINRALPLMPKESQAATQDDKQKGLNKGAYVPFDNIKKAKTVIEANPDLVNLTDEDGRTLLHFAVLQHNKDMVTLLLENKAKVDAKTKEGWTPLHVAIVFGFGSATEIAEILLAHNADVNAKNKDQNDDTPLHLAVALFTNTKIEIETVKLLLSKKADVNAKNKNGQTPLHFAVDDIKKRELIELLLANNADINAKTNEGITPLKIASGNKEITELLLKHGAKE